MKAEDLKIEDLLDECDKCGGKGTFQEEIPPQQGFGTRLVAISAVTCPKCQGKRRLCTQLGEILREFVNFVK